MKKNIKNNKLNNLGYSLVELIVIVAIIAVMLGTGVWTYQWVAGTEAKRAASSMEYVLNDVKTGAMSRYGEFLVLRYIDTSAFTPTQKKENEEKGISKSGYYVEKHMSYIVNEQDKTRDYPDNTFNYICNGKVDIRIKSKEGTVTTLDKNKSFMIEFDRATGKVKTTKISTVNQESNWEGVSGITLDRIFFKAGLREKEMEFYVNTGKYIIK